MKLPSKINDSLLLLLILVIPSVPFIVGHLVGEVISSVLSLLALIPVFVLFLERARSYTIVACSGLAYGVGLTVIASFWVWSFGDLPIAIMVFAAILVGSYYAIVFSLAKLVINFLTRLIPKYLQPAATIVVLSLLLVLAEAARSYTPYFVTPLATTPLAASSYITSPIAGLVGVTCFVLFVMLVNGMLAVALVGLNGVKRIYLVIATVGVCATASLVAANSDTASEVHPLLSKQDTQSSLCAVTDKARRLDPYQFKDKEQLLNVIELASMIADCGLIVFPETTSYVLKKNINTPSGSGALEGDKPSSVLVGVLTADGVEGDDLIVQDETTNSVCEVNMSTDELECISKVDKEYLVPLIESELFHNVPALRSFGSWLTRTMTGLDSLGVNTQQGSVLNISGESVGILNCIEMFVSARTFQNKSGEAVDPSFIIVVADLSSFPESKVMTSQIHRAVAFQAASRKTPVLLVSTDESVLFGVAGQKIKETQKQGDIYVWDTL